MLKYFLNFFLGILHFPLLYRTLKKQVISYVLNNSHILNVRSFFFFRKIRILLTMILTFLFFLFFRKILISVQGLFFPFFLFILQKDFDIFHVLLFEVFLCLLIIFIYQFYIYSKNL